MVCSFFLGGAKNVRQASAHITAARILSCGIQQLTYTPHERIRAAAVHERHFFVFDEGRGEIKKSSEPCFLVLLRRTMKNDFSRTSLKNLFFFFMPYFLSVFSFPLLLTHYMVSTGLKGGKEKEVFFVAFSICILFSPDPKGWKIQIENAKLLCK